MSSGVKHGTGLAAAQIGKAALLVADEVAQRPPSVALVEIAVTEKSAVILASSHLGQRQHWQQYTHEYRYLYVIHATVH